MGAREALQRWGWSSYFEALWNEGERGSAVPARVIAQHRRFWRIAGAFGECWGEASGKLRLAAEEGVEWPTVGECGYGPASGRAGWGLQSAPRGTVSRAVLGIGRETGECVKQRGCRRGCDS